MATLAKDLQNRGIVLVDPHKAHKESVEEANNNPEPPSPATLSFIALAQQQPQSSSDR